VGVCVSELYPIDAPDIDCSLSTTAYGVHDGLYLGFYNLGFACKDMAAVISNRIQEVTRVIRT
jgi:hypothetical protein